MNIQLEKATRDQHNIHLIFRIMFPLFSIYRITTRLPLITILLVLILSTSGCGKKGPLTLPEQPQQHQE